VHDTPPSYLIRWLNGRHKPEVFRMRSRLNPGAWRFADGVAVVDQSLSDALLWAEQLRPSAPP